MPRHAPEPIVIASHRERDPENADPLVGAALSTLTGEIRWPQSTGKVYHYTDAAGANGILSARRVWATAASALNDAAEFQFGVALIKAALEGWQSPRPPLLDRRGEVMAILDELEHTGPSAPAYIFSTSTSPRVLSQYRNYAGGRGYALEFDTSKLLVPLGTSWITGAWLTVVYDVAEQEQLIDRLLTRMVDNRHVDAEFLDVRIAEILSLAALAMKDEAFASEHEVRLVWMTHQPPNYRSSDRAILPFLELAHGWDAVEWRDIESEVPGLGITVIGTQMFVTDAEGTSLDVNAAYVGPPTGPDAHRRARSLAGLAVATGSPEFAVFDSEISYVD